MKLIACPFKFCLTKIVWVCFSHFLIGSMHQYATAQTIARLTPSAYQRSHLLRISTIPNLEVGFTLRCFQSLSIPDLATGQCYWRNSPQTRGQFIPVLSYQGQIFSRINACSRQETNLSHASFHTLLYGTDYSLIVFKI